MAHEIIALQKTRPFAGLRIHISDGTTYDVRHPEMMVVTRSMVFIALPPVKGGVPERSVRRDPIHVTRIEPLVNGAKPARKQKRR